MDSSVVTEGLADLDVRGGERLVSELLRNVATTHAGASAPLADLGWSFPHSTGNWHEDHAEARHETAGFDHNDAPRDHAPQPRASDGPRDHEGARGNDGPRDHEGARGNDGPRDHEGAR
ncbi:MAG: hypothetical protein JWM45_4209, partial [Pseudonocardiales bacterium]|nr:hypothetical protein [Pseudonocardiales bacterium]